MFSLGLLIYGDWFSSKVSFSHLVNIIGVTFCFSLELWKLETGVLGILDMSRFVQKPLYITR